MIAEYLTITQPDDWHMHLRDGPYLARTVGDASQQFHRCIIMPNLNPPLSDVESLLAYKARIESHIPEGAELTPLMVWYLKSSTTPEAIEKAHQAGIIAAKFYPAGATTHSQWGVQAIETLYPVFSKMADIGMPLLIHGETTEPHIDIFDREAQFIEKHLTQLIHEFPELKVVIEHITTKEAVDFVLEAPHQVAATITPQHLWYSRNDLLVGGIKPDFYCLPILKREAHQRALQEAAFSGLPKFFLGTDSAPHTHETKYTDCGCAGIYSAYSAVELYAEIFERFGHLDRLEAFASHFGPDFYQLPRNTKTLTLVKEPWVIPSKLQFGSSYVTPMHAGKQLQWQIKKQPLTPS